MAVYLQKRQTIPGKHSSDVSKILIISSSNLTKNKPSTINMLFSIFVLAIAYSVLFLKRVCLKRNPHVV